jgi:pimeloyl-ACP methyl ester carboxylesterase
LIPRYFGKTDSPLYGVYHPPASNPRNSGVLLCYPFGQEYMRAHRAYRQLALLLSKAGHHVLRFDYAGTGDSSEELEDVDAQRWIEDTGEAIQELRDTAGTARVTLVGLRLGGLIAAAAAEGRGDVERLILWDPVISGREYERELLLEIAAGLPFTEAVDSGNRLTEDGVLHYNGFSMTRSFRETLGNVDLLGLRPEHVSRVFHVVSHQSDQFMELRKAWEAHPGYRYQHTPAPHDWNYVDNFGGILLPQPVIQAIVQWMDQ